MEEVDVKVQEAIDSITAHGKRIKNILKNDPVNNKIDKNWKLNFQSKEMLFQAKKEPTNSDKNESGIKSNDEPKDEPKTEPKNVLEIESNNQSKKDSKKDRKNEPNQESMDQVKSGSTEKKPKSANRTRSEKKTEDSEVKNPIKNPPNNPSKTSQNPSKNLTIQISNIEPDKSIPEMFAIKGEWVHGKLQQRNAAYQSKAVCYVSFHHNRIKEYFR